jgi:hypothetical protein
MFLESKPVGKVAYLLTMLLNPAKSLMLVGATGIEPVTPSMSRKWARARASAYRSATASSRRWAARSRRITSVAAPNSSSRYRRPTRRASRTRAPRPTRTSDGVRQAGERIAGQAPSRRSPAALRLAHLGRLAPWEGFEPPTGRLTAACSTTELPRNGRYRCGPRAWRTGRPSARARL